MHTQQQEQSKVICKSPEFVGGSKDDFEGSSPHNFVLEPTLLSCLNH